MTSPARDPLGLPAVRVFDTDRARSVEQDPGDERAGADIEVRPVHDRMQVRTRCAQATAATDVAVERGEALLAIAVDVFGELVAGLLHGAKNALNSGLVAGPRSSSSGPRAPR